ncbi:MAG TPA: AraC family transcriptional regulator [Clostridiaceae bacterium]
MIKREFPIITDEISSLPFYVKTIGSEENQFETDRPNGYPDYHWLHTGKGSGKLIINGEEHLIGQNMGFFFDPYIPHKYYCETGPWETYYITFNGYAVKELLKLLKFPSYGVYYLKSREAIEGYMNIIANSINSKGPLSGYKSSSILYEFLTEFKDYISEENKEVNRGYVQLKPAVKYIEDNFERDLTLEEIASTVRVTPQYLCKLFKENFNMRPFVYITKLRLRKAKELLIQDSEKQVGQIAYETGYKDVSYFCAMFKKYEGMSPVNFRKIHLGIK